jgi:hypothetical protein
VTCIEYQLVRTRVLGLAKSRRTPFDWHVLNRPEFRLVIVGCSTLTLFTLLVFMTSFIFSLFLPSAWINGSPAALAKLVEDGTAVDDTDYLFGWPYSTNALASGLWKEAYSVLNDLFDSYTSSHTSTSRATSDSESSSYRYERTKSTRSNARKSDARNRPPRRNRVSDREAQNSVRTGPFKSTVSVDRSVKTSERHVHLEPSHPDDDKDFTAAQEQKPTLLTRLVRRFLLGIAIVGAFSFATFGWAMVIPRNWIRRRGRRPDGDDKSLYLLVIVVFLVIGIVRCVSRS